MDGRLGRDWLPAARTAGKEARRFVVSPSGYRCGMRPKEMTEDLGALREDLGQVKERADAKLAKAEADRPELAWLLDVRVVLVAAAVSLLIAFVARLAGLPFLLALLLFLV